MKQQTGCGGNRSWLQLSCSGEPCCCAEESLAASWNWPAGVGAGDVKSRASSNCLLLLSSSSISPLFLPPYFLLTQFSTFIRTWSMATNVNQLAICNTMHICQNLKTKQTTTVIITTPYVHIHRPEVNTGCLFNCFTFLFLSNKVFHWI